MTIKHTYALFDNKTQTFLNPIHLLTEGDAIRWAQTLVDGDKTREMTAKYPNDYILFRLQDFDDKLGKYIPRENESETAAIQPKEIIMLGTLQREQERTFSVKELITMILNQPELANIVEFNKAKEN